MSSLKVGDRAPSFQLPDETGTLRRLEELVSAGPLVIFFYPKDETAICTKEACGFRDEYSQFTDLSAQVVGISRDSVDSHASFKTHHHLPFPLLADKGGKVAAEFGVKKTMGLVPGRATFVVDRDCVIRLAYSSALQAQAHIVQSLLAIREIQRA